MIVEINNDADLYAQQLALDVQNKPLTALLKEMQRWYSTPPHNRDSVEIQINPELVQQSYRVNPSMLARNAHLGIYSYCRGLYRDGKIVLLYTNNSDDGVGFFRRLKDFLTNPENATLQFSVPIEEVPESYRYRPEQLRYRIKQMTNIKLITRKTKTHWKYSKGK